MILEKPLYNCYKIQNHRIRSLIIKTLKRLEGGEFYSYTLRKIFKKYHNIDIGMYTYGGCFVPGQVDPHTTIGRYTSTAQNIRIFNRNHPMEFKSMHGFFFNSKLGYCDNDLVEYTPIKIGNDVWIGYNSIILPKVSIIADGAVIGAGAVVHEDIPPYAVVTGCPARIVRYRFPQETIEKLVASKWWEKDIEEIRPNIHEFQKPYKHTNHY